MDIADLDTASMTTLLYDLQTTYDVKIVEEKYGFTIPQWLTIKYRCVACAKETRSRIQAINIRQANKQLICPFCRKTSKMFTIHIEKSIKIKLNTIDYYISCYKCQQEEHDKCLEVYCVTDSEGCIVDDGNCKCKQKYHDFYTVASIG